MVTPGLPLHYYSFTIGYAQVDSHLLAMLGSRSWNIEIPKTVRAIATRPDLLLGLLEEDPTLLPRCHPFSWVGRFPLRLSRAVMRPEICELLPQIQPGDHVIHHKIRELATSTPTVIYVDGDRTNCRISNLRTLTEVPESTSQF